MSDKIEFTANHSDVSTYRGFQFQFNCNRLATCPSCGTALIAKLKFCVECGEMIMAEKHCTEWGAMLAPGAKF